MSGMAEGVARGSGVDERLPATFRWLLGGILVSALASFVFPFLALFLTARGLSAEETGLVVSLFGGGTVVAAPVAGALADRIGRRPVMLASLVGNAALTAFLAATESPLAVVPAVLALGVVAFAFQPAAAATLADVAPPAGRTRAFALLYATWNLGMAVSFVAGGLLAPYGWGKLFALDAATTTAFALLLWLRVPETRPAASAAVGGPAPGIRAALADGPFLSFVALNLLWLFAFLQFMVAIPIAMTRAGLTAADFGMALAGNGLLIALLQPLAGRHLGRFDSGRVLALAAVFVGLGYGGYALCTTAWQYALSTAVWTLGEILGAPTGAAVVAALAPAALRGRYQGLFTASGGVGMLVAPALGSVVLERLGAPVLWSGCLVLSLAVAAGHLAIAGPRRRRVAALAVAERES